VTGGSGPAGADDEFLPQPRRRSLRPLIAVVVLAVALLVAVRVMTDQGSSPRASADKHSTSQPTGHPTPRDQSVGTSPIALSERPVSDILIPLAGGPGEATEYSAKQLAFSEAFVNEASRPVLVSYPLEIRSRSSIVWTVEFAGLVGLSDGEQLGGLARPTRLERISPLAHVVLLVKLRPNCPSNSAPPRRWRTPVVELALHGYRGRISLSVGSQGRSGYRTICGTGRGGVLTSAGRNRMRRRSAVSMDDVTRTPDGWLPR
jgi:hypothetical protein